MVEPKRITIDEVKKKLDNGEPPFLSTRGTRTTGANRM